MMKEMIIETVGTKEKAVKVVKFWTEMEKKIGGKKKYRYREHPHAKGYQILMRD